MEDFGFALLPRFFSKRINVFSQDLFEQLSRTAFFLENNNKDGVFQPAWRMVDFLIFSVDMVDMVDAERMDPSSQISHYLFARVKEENI